MAVVIKQDWIEDDMTDLINFLLRFIILFPIYLSSIVKFRGPVTEWPFPTFQG